MFVLEVEISSGKQSHRDFLRGPVYAYLIEGVGSNNSEYTRLTKCVEQEEDERERM